MKKDVRILWGGNAIAKATIVNDKNGLSVVNKEPAYENDDTFIKDFLKNCINMDEWVHSRYVSVADAKYKRSKDRKKIRAILSDKIKAREEEIETLRMAKIILSKWSV